MKSTPEKECLAVQPTGQVIPWKARAKAFARTSMRESDIDEPHGAAIVCLTKRIRLLKEMRSCGMLEQVVSYIRLEIEELTQVWSDISSGSDSIT